MRVEYKNRWYAVKRHIKEGTSIRRYIYYKGGEYALVSLEGKIVACKV